VTEDLASGYVHMYIPPFQFGGGIHRHLIAALSPLHYNQLYYRLNINEMWAQFSIDNIPLSHLKKDGEGTFLNLFTFWKCLGRRESLGEIPSSKCVKSSRGLTYNCTWYQVPCHQVTFYFLKPYLTITNATARG
jgi:hypothetical protein